MYNQHSVLNLFSISQSILTNITNISPPPYFCFCGREIKKFLRQKSEIAVRLEKYDAIYDFACIRNPRQRSKYPCPLFVSHIVPPHAVTLEFAPPSPDHLSPGRCRFIRPISAIEHAPHASTIAPKS